MSDLELTMAWLGMDRYLERFIEAGFDSWDTVLEITEDDLNTLNVDLGHRRKLQREITKSKRQARDPVSNIPDYGTDLPQPNTLRTVPFSSTDGQQSGPPPKRGYRHHPKSDINAPERPYSAYVLFSNHIREQVKDQNLSFIQLSKVVGEKWQQLSRDEKEEWKNKGALPWERYKAELAEYQKTDDFRDYQRYLANFKAAQDIKNPPGKPGTMVQNPASSTYRRNIFSSKDPQMAVSPTSQAETERKHPKVAIKQTKRDEETWDQGPGSEVRPRRARQACESCRNRNIRCYGEQPTCRHCRELGIECFYTGGERNQSRRQNDEIWQKLKAYEELLLKMVSQVDDDDQQAIQKAILMPPSDDAAKHAYEETIRDESQSGSHDDGADSDPSAAGSMGPTDQFNKDELLQQHPTQHAPAFAGQSSEINWTERLNQELLPEQGAEMFRSRNRNRDVSEKPQPYEEDTDKAVVGHQINPVSLPVKSTADSLVNAYFSTIHTSFPILKKLDFLNQYDQLYSMKELEGFEQRTYIAKLQLVFAIAAVHAHLVQAHWAGDARDHVLYFSRARALAVDSGIFNDDCHLAQVQVFGLSGMYLLVTHQLNRAWNFSGLAIRSAQALGLHLRDVSSSLSVDMKEFHAYNWFALMTLESMLTLVTGRPTMINSQDCSVVIPGTMPEVKSPSMTTPPSGSSYRSSAREKKYHPSSPGMSEPRQGLLLNRTRKHDTTRIATMYFVHYAELCTLVKEAVSELYRPGIRRQKRSEVRSTIDGFDNRLFEWKDGVNPPFNVATPSSDPETESCRVALRILFYSTRIIINRPCLCRIEERIEEQARSSKWKNIDSAKKCVESARALLNLILHKPDSVTLREGTLWWMLLHHLKRALTVLLLELAFRAEHMPSEADEILVEAKAAVSWLHHISNSSTDARRTCSYMTKLLRLAAQKVGGDTSDIMTPLEEESAPTYPGQQQPPSAGYGRAGQTQFAPSDENAGLYFQEQWQDYRDLTERNELDEFGFLRAEGGLGSLFPTPSEMDRMNEEMGGED